MKRQFLLIIVLLLSLTVTAQKRKPTSADRFAGLDTTFARVLTDWKAAGFAVAVVEKGKVVYAKGFGYRDMERKLPVTPNTLFAIGSCTKHSRPRYWGCCRKTANSTSTNPLRSICPR